MFLQLALRIPYCAYEIRQDGRITLTQGVIKNPNNGFSFKNPRVHSETTTAVLPGAVRRQ
jgi:hypothetical protein